MTLPPDGWRSGNRYTQLENGEAYFPAVRAAVDAAVHEVLIETFILFDDKVGRDLRQTLVAADPDEQRHVLLVVGLDEPARRTADAVIHPIFQR